MKTLEANNIKIGSTSGEIGKEGMDVLSSKGHGQMPTANLLPCRQHERRDRQGGHGCSFKQWIRAGGNRQFAAGFPSMSISIGENSSKTGPVLLPRF
jgi:hypothetical protein